MGKYTKDTLKTFQYWINLPLGELYDEMLETNAFSIKDGQYFWDNGDDPFLEKAHTRQEFITEVNKRAEFWKEIIDTEALAWVG